MDVACGSGVYPAWGGAPGSWLGLRNGHDSATRLPTTAGEGANLSVRRHQIVPVTGRAAQGDPGVPWLCALAHRLGVKADQTVELLPAQHRLPVWVQEVYLFVTVTSTRGQSASLAREGTRREALDGAVWN